MPRMANPGVSSKDYPKYEREVKAWLREQRKLDKEAEGPPSEPSDPRPPADRRGAAEFIDYLLTIMEDRD